jgi:hypothetical protein
MSSVDWLGLALDLEQQAKRVESQTAQRAMLAGANGLRLMAADDVRTAIKNLRLMSAAPDLLAALQTLMRVHDEPAGFAGKYGRKLDEAIEAQRIKVDSATALARAAIAKATEA